MVQIACSPSLSISLEMFNVVQSLCIVFQKEKKYVAGKFECDMVLLFIECKKSCKNQIFVFRSMDKHISNG